mmetsp:Transcript_6066/g.18286  ORF Transcript_6066/g.18286 Transcript_6066/m.18286 type:complete len:139 (-) Transcript_6066:121-537(-)
MSVALLGVALGVITVSPALRRTQAFVRGRHGDCPAARHAERQLWAVYLVVAALVYVGFAALREASWLPVEVGGVAAYGLAALLGARRQPRLLVLGWSLHPVWDIVIHANAPFVPDWYRWACLSFDLVAAVWLARLPRD